MLSTPSSFPNDPEGFLGNQCGHACIGALAALALWPWWGLAAVIPVALVYFLFWEIGVQSGRLLRDSIADTVHTAAGAGVLAAALAGMHSAALVIAVAELGALVYGAWRRS